MKAAIIRLTVAAFVLCLTGGTALAQEGFPLKGSWIGTWGPSKLHDNDILLVINWDGKAISGQINPGTDNMDLKNATLNPDGWQVHLEADGKDKTGKAVHYTFDGKIDNLAFRNRTVTGTWKGGTESGPFKIQRQ